MLDVNFSYNTVDDLFSVNKRRQSAHVMLESHFHSSYEAYYLLSGKRLFFIKDRTIQIQAGDLILLHANLLHKTADAQMPKHEKIILNFKEEFLPFIERRSFSFLNNFQDDYRIIHFSAQDKLIIEKFLMEIVKEAQELKDEYVFSIQALLVQLLIFVARNMKEHIMEVPAYINPMHERISEIVRYINENYKKDLSLQYVADHFYVSPYYLSRAFKEVTGFGFVEYVNSVRVKEAKKMLEETSLKVYTIAEYVGYGSITHFGRIFKEITGHAPLYYRKRS